MRLDIKIPDNFIHGLRVLPGILPPESASKRTVQHIGNSPGLNCNTFVIKDIISFIFNLKICVPAWPMWKRQALTFQPAQKKRKED